jgi:hypothetical protein
MNYLLVQLSNNTPSEHLLEDVTFERNVITNYEGGMSVASMWNGIIRNNLFVSPAAGRALSSNYNALGTSRPLKD